MPLSLLKSTDFQLWPEFLALTKRLGIQADLDSRPITKLTIDWTNQFVTVQEEIIIEDDNG